MTVLNRQNSNVRLGTRQCDAVYAGATKVWKPLPSYLVSSVGQMSSPDTPDLTPIPPVAFTFSFRPVDWEISFATIVTHAAAGQQEWNFYMQNGAIALAGSSDGTNQVYANILFASDVASLLPLDDRDVIVTARIDASGSPHRVQGAISIDNGVTWLTTPWRNYGISSFFNSNQPIRTSSGFQGRIYSLQMESINRREFQFPGIAPNNYFESADTVTFPGDLEVIVRIAPVSWGSGAIQSIVGKDLPAPRGWNFRLNTSGYPHGVFSIDGSTQFQVTSSNPAPFSAGQAGWIRMTRIASTGVCQFFTASDGPSEPTTWTKLGNDINGTSGVLTSNTAAPWRIGARNLTGATEPYRGRIMRTIIRNGIAGPTVLDVSETNASNVAQGATSFIATTGQMVTVFQTAGNEIIKALPDQLVWRFDAAEHLKGTSWTDLRGRVWTLTNAAAIVHP